MYNYNKKQNIRLSYNDHQTKNIRLYYYQQSSARFAGRNLHLKVAYTLLIKSMKMINYKYFTKKKYYHKEAGLIFYFMRPVRITKT